MNKNMRAFLALISASEGTNYGTEGGYNILVGSTPSNPKTFTSYLAHPRKLSEFRLKSGKVIKSSAAGRYQILRGIFDHYRKSLNLDDKSKYPLGAFSPDAQDAIALQLIKECRAIELIENGHIVAAIKACASRWASFPGAGYGQNEHSIPTLLATFINHGGILLS